MRAAGRGTGWIGWIPFVALVLVNTAVSLSTTVMRWWSVQSAPGESRLPDAADGILRARTNSSDADVHSVLWFLAAAALVLGARHLRGGWLFPAVVSVWAYSGLLEVGQRWVPERTPQWVDFLANGLGIAVGVVVGVGVRAVLARSAASQVGAPGLSSPAP